MAKWGYLARAYNIEDFCYMRECEVDNGDTIDDSLEAVVEDIKMVLEINEDNYISVKETPGEYRQIRKCKKWLRDFGKGVNKNGKGK